MELLEEGPVRGVIRIQLTWQQSSFVQDITLHEGADQVVAENDINWHETHVLLKAAFELAASGHLWDSLWQHSAANHPQQYLRAGSIRVPALRWAELATGSMVSD